MRHAAAPAMAALAAFMLLLAGGALAQSAPPQSAPSLPPAGRPSAPPPPPPVGQSVARAPATPAAPQVVLLEAGSGRLLQLPAPASTVLAAEPAIARVQPASATSLFVVGVAAGRTTVIATAEDGTPVAQYDVTVRPGAFAPATALGATAPRAAGAPAASISPGAIEAAIRSSVRGMQAVRVTAAGPNGFVLNGTVANATDAQRAEAVARAFAGPERDVLNQLEMLSSVQVNVRVRVAEISRQITRELGFNWQAIGQIGSFVVGLRSGASAASVAGAVLGSGLSSGLTGNPSRIGLGGAGRNFDINAIIDALAQDQLISILAEPNLTAQSGETASFLAGGEFPVPVAASAISNAITIEFKQFGVSLAFVPTVLGPDRLNLRVRPEVSELSQQGAISLPLSTGTVTIPALTVRRAETTVELGSGQSFAIAGLLQRNSRQTNAGVSGLGELPVIGALFRSDRFQRDETELVIIVTPYLVRPVSRATQLAAPTDGFRPAIDIDRILYQRQIARGAPLSRLRGQPDAGFILE